MLIMNIFNHSFIIFILLGTTKLVLESYAKKNINTGGKESSTLISKYFILIGSLTPLLILTEIFLLKHSLPVWLCILFAIIQVSLWIIRYFSIKALGKFYSVNVRIADEHKLVSTGIYKYLRHPLYLVGLLENIFYPLACSAYYTAILLFLIDTPAILYRRNAEEKALIEKFGSYYVEYKKKTLF
jgi:protein-S-isoprenylcysteine O-methyltransferase Ste14